MANEWLVSNLIRSLKLRQLIVTSDDETQGFVTADFLRLINEVVRSRFVPLLKRTKEEYLIVREDLTLTAARDTYPLPKRAAAESLKTILYSDGAGKWIPLERTTEERAHEFEFAQSSCPAGYYLRDDSVVFVPVPSGGEQVRFLRYNRPSRVVEADEVGEISAINTATGGVTIKTVDADGEFTVTTAPTTFTSSARYDLVKGSPGFRTRVIDLTATVASNVLTFAAASLPADLEVGDFVCLAGETPIAQIPAELHPALAQEVARTLLEAKGDKKADRAKDTLKDMLTDADAMLHNRVQAAPKYIKNDNAPGSWSKFRRGGWR